MVTPLLAKFVSCPHAVFVAILSQTESRAATKFSWLWRCYLIICYLNITFKECKSNAALHKETFLELEIQQL